MTDSTPLPQSVANGIIVPQIIGVACTTFVCGLVQASVVDYFQRFGRRDRRSVRAFVGAISLLSTLTAVLVTAYGADLAASRLGFAWVPPSAEANAIVNALCAAITQAFFAWRCYSTLPRYCGVVFLALVTAAILTSLGAGVGIAVVNIVRDGWFYTNAKSLADVWLLQQIFLYTSAATDLVITLVLVVRLHALGRATQLDGVRRPRQPWIRRLIQLSLSTAALTAAWALIAAVLCVIETNTVWYNIFASSLPQIHAICALYVLRNRSSCVGQDVSPLPQKTPGLDGLAQIKVESGSCLWSEAVLASPGSDFT